MSLTLYTLIKDEQNIRLDAVLKKEKPLSGSEAYLIYSISNSICADYYVKQEPAFFKPSRLRLTYR